MIQRRTIGRLAREAGVGKEFVGRRVGRQVGWSALNLREHDRSARIARSTGPLARPELTTGVMPRA